MYNRTDEEVGFTMGVWFAIEQLISHGQESIAINIIYESGIPEWEFRDNLEQTQYMYEELSAFLDIVFNKGE